MKAAFRKAIPLVAAFLIGTMFVGAAWAVVTTRVRGNMLVTGTVTAKNFRYTKPHTVMLNVPGSAFVANQNTGDDVNHGNYSGEVDINTPGAAAVAPVELPNGAVVTKVVIWYAPVGADADLVIHLESNIAANDHDDMVVLDAVAACTVDPCHLGTTTIFRKTITNKTRHYGIWASNQSSASNVTLYKVQIFYKTAAVGPQAAVPPAGATGVGTGANP
jgi:hypothetical protein